MTINPEELAQVIYEAIRGYYTEHKVDDYHPPWNQAHQSPYLAAGVAVANFVKRDLAGVQFSAFVGAGVLDLEQRLTALEEQQKTNEERIQGLRDTLGKFMRPEYE